MSTWNRLIQALSLRLRSQPLAHQAYLAQAVDNSDLERRMHALERHYHSSVLAGGWGPL